MGASVQVIIVTGPVGAGKTSVVIALSSLLAERNIPHAVIDLDALRTCYPAPADDPFHMQLGMRNFAAVASNYRAVGARHLLVADVVEQQSDRDRYTAALPDAAIVVVRLVASIANLWRRLEGREVGESLDWHRRRAVELQALMDAAGLEDVLVSTDDKTVDEVAREILRCL